jgi:sterol desaturase/sphingolipid hydroxylase (fatty acid hydroxylase superfamily)
LVGGLLRTVPLFLLGFRLEVLAGVLPGAALHGLLLHANVRWSFGPLRYVIASPAFHRWHHAADAEGRDKNFAGLLPVWDLIFGTFHMPGRPPVRCGVDEEVPKGFFGQLVWPWRAGAAGATEGCRGRRLGANAIRGAWGSGS